MAHLSQEQLLLLCDGELQSESRSHYQQCAQCAAAFAELNAVLGMACVELKATLAEESAVAHAASHDRLERRLGRGAVVEAHLSDTDLILCLDGELAPPLAAHAAECAVCSARVTEFRAVLFEAETEISSTVPLESAEERAASWAALQRKLYQQPKVITFPVRRVLAYAAAAAVAFVATTTFWQQQRGTAQPETVAVVSSPSAPLASAPAALTAPVPAAASAPAPAAAEEVRDPAPAPPLILAQRTPAPVVETFRGTIPASLALAPEPKALSGPALELPVERHGGALALGISLPATLGPAPDRPLAGPEAARGLLAGYKVLVDSGLWREDIRPEATAAGLHFTGSVENQASRQSIIAALRQNAGSLPLEFDLRVRQPQVQLIKTAVIRQVSSSAPGGMVRSSLLAHYSDAAQRSFQAPTPALLESEIDRYVNDVFRGQSELLAHSYGLRQLLSVVDSSSLDPDSRRNLAKMVSFHTAGISDQQRRIYDNLSEALPRKFWIYRDNRDSLNAGSDWQADSAALLEESLELERRLTTMLGASAAAVDVSTANVSVGELLHRIRARVERLEAAVKTLQ